jgi:ABC-type multidrug transport system fused ATPase/permease subunit
MSLSTFGKVKRLLTPAIRKKAIILQLLLLVSVLFEAIGLGLIIPVVNELTGAKPVGAVGVTLQHFFQARLNGVSALFLFLGIFVGFYIVKTFFLTYLVSRQTRFNQELSEDISGRMLDSYLHRPYTFFLDQHSGVLTKNITSEVNSFVAYIQALLQLQTELSIVFGIMISLLWLQPVGAILVFVLVGGASILLVRVSRKRVSRWGRERQQWEASRAKSLSQTLGGVRDIRLFGGEAYFQEQFSIYNKKFFTSQRKIQYLTQVQRYYLECLLIMTLVILSLVFVMQRAPLVQILPALSLFLFAALRILPSANRIVNQFQNMRFSSAGVDIVYDHVYTDNQPTRPETNTVVLPIRNSIRLENIWFTYPGASNPTLQGLNLEIKIGSVTGITGPSGIGKTTVANILMGLYKPSSGKIYFDSVAQTETGASYSNYIAYIPQQVYLLDDTIARNIAFGVPDEFIDRQRLANAASTAQLESLLAGLPQGVGTSVGERGIRLSGGQQQRIAIARALYHGARVLIFDEGTSGIDAETEEAVVGAIVALKGEYSIITITHNPITLRLCESVFYWYGAGAHLKSAGQCTIPYVA